MPKFRRLQPQSLVPSELRHCQDRRSGTAELPARLQAQLGVIPFLFYCYIQFSTSPPPLLNLPSLMQSGPKSSSYQLLLLSRPGTRNL